MTLDEFWELIESTRKPNARTHADQLTAVLAARSVDDILDFGAWFDRLWLDAMDRRDLWGAAYLIGGGCSHDQFMDFCHGLILRGRSVYETVLADSDNLADVSHPGNIQIEVYIASAAYEMKTGRDDYEELERRISDPLNTCSESEKERWDFDSSQEMQQRYPRLWTKFG